MSDDESGSVDGGLTPEAAALIDDYFARFRAEALAAGAQGWEDEDADLRAYVRDRLEGSVGTAEEAVRVLADLGATEALVAAYVDASPVADSEGLLTNDGSRTGTGRFLGSPYDLRASRSSERYASRIWNPLDRRVFVPKALGIGWTVNFGALAVLARLVRPDDEDAPFDAVPPRIVVATLAAPLAALTVFAVLAAVNWARLPALVPIHWGISGQADGYWSRGTSLVFLSVLAVVPVVEAVWIHLRRRPPFTLVVASALSLSVTTLALVLLTQSLFTLDGGTGVWPIGVGLACVLALPFVLLVSMSRIGRAAERRRDLSGNSPKGRV
jgi:Protein of unknown function (DUF1648)/Family of unknown function (DUF5808)